ncbi:OLC1v1011147C3 [Oldenlandia corymbosa var. corymbosa]|uniref:OLC1v1011147C3 n=1 Tax=Oldenlandia corymbosa var. corymbosa TaxID=529605 RepID=A0AAV1DW12_OLDCO|nr:OLC1v1011147C3 [Oldenlandia corymbosa var. corymbosa]
MRTLSVYTSSLTSFRLNVPRNFETSYAPASSMSSTSVARPQFQPSKHRNFGTTKRTSNFSWMATVGENVQSSPVPTSVPVRVAHELLQAGHQYLDVRTPEEFSAGHAAGAINVPYMFRVGSGLLLPALVHFLISYVFFHDLAIVDQMRISVFGWLRL